MPPQPAHVVSTARRAYARARVFFSLFAAALLALPTARARGALANRIPGACIQAWMVKYIRRHSRGRVYSYAMSETRPSRAQRELYSLLFLHTYNMIILLRERPAVAADLCGLYIYSNIVACLRQGGGGAACGGGGRAQVG